MKKKLILFLTILIIANNNCNNNPSQINKKKSCCPLSKNAKISIIIAVGSIIALVATLVKMNQKKQIDITEFTVKTSKEIIFDPITAINDIINTMEVVTPLELTQSENTIDKIELINTEKNSKSNSKLNTCNPKSSHNVSNEQLQPIESIIKKWNEFKETVIESMTHRYTQLSENKSNLKFPHYDSLMENENFNETEQI